jgi:choline dehydrogenase
LRLQPLANPVITPRFLTDQFDLDVGVALARQSQVMFQSAPFSSVVADPFTTLPSGSSTADFENYLKTTSFVSAQSYSLYVFIHEL